ncbi:hypothetical protein R3P38DRAFT_3191319 [Favolaschia claudopus]|uniref:Uncharacterized protein n=1 Tax=Favolaschia claudopus TaxID=2862362 RepID=A0AAW0BKR8_9AGAR
MSIPSNSFNVQAPHNLSSATWQRLGASNPMKGAPSQPVLPVGLYVPPTKKPFLSLSSLGRSQGASLTLDWEGRSYPRSTSRLDSPAKRADTFALTMAVDWFTAMGILGLNEYSSSSL